MPLGKRVVIPVRVSEPMRDAIDEARGETPRSVWIEEAVAARLGGGPAGGVATPEPSEPAPKLRARPAARKAVPPPVRFAEPPAGPDPAEAAKRQIKEIVAALPAPVESGCPPHPKRRVLKGLCGACGRNVGNEKVA